MNAAAAKVKIKKTAKQLEEEAEELAIQEAAAAKQAEIDRIEEERLKEEAILKRAAEKAEQFKREQEQFAKEKAEKDAAKKRAEQFKKDRDAKLAEEAEKARIKQEQIDERKRIAAEKIRLEQIERERKQKLINDKNDYWKRQSVRIAPEGLGEEVRELCKFNEYSELEEIVKEWDGHDVLNECDIDGWSPIIWACKSGALECAKCLTKTWINEFDTDLHQKQAWLKKVNQVDPDFGNTLLMFAAQSGNCDLCLFLISKGGDRNLQNEDGFTALHWAAYRGHLPVCKAIVEVSGGVSCKVDALTRGDQTARQAAVVGRHKEVIKYLLEVEESRK